MHELRLRPKEDLRLRQGHLWVFSNEVASHPPAGPGDLVSVVNAQGVSLGTALYHPHSLICARLLGGEIFQLDRKFFLERLHQALELRRQLFAEDDCYRVVHGESDLLPGLIVDRYAADLVVQTLTAGMEKRQETICEALEELFTPRSIVERNDTPLRTYEELPQRAGVIRGSWSRPGEVIEHGLRYSADLLGGQKTGLYLDQKRNRQAASAYCRGRNVLDGFCNAGGFGLNAARAGAARVTGVDSSAPVLELARLNAELNQLNRIHFVQADVFEFLEKEARSGTRYGAIILDPPSFTRSRKNVPAARRAYRRLNQLAFQILEEGGYLITASCSHHIAEELFYETVQQAAQRAGRCLQLLEQRHESPDHPALPAMPETRYLKLGIFRALSV